MKRNIQSAATIKDAADALVKLKAEGNEDFYNRFLDYLHTMGLRDAVLHLRTPTLDLTASSKKELNYQKLTEMLLAGSRRDDWHKANVKLKAQLDEQMYREFVAHIPTEDDNFFVLWDKVVHHLGKTESVVSQRVLMKQWSKLVMPADGNLTTFLGQISAISERVNTLAGHTVYGDELKIHQLADGVEVHNGTRFKQAIDKIRTSTKKKTWEQVKALFKATDSKRYTECIDLEDKDKGQAISSNTETKQMGTHCRYCKQNNHTIDQCPTKPARNPRYNGVTFGESNCRNWINLGNCHWESDPRNPTKRKCRFQLPPGLRGTGKQTMQSSTNAVEVHDQRIISLQNSYTNLEKEVAQIASILSKQHDSSATSAASAQSVSATSSTTAREDGDIEIQATDLEEEMNRLGLSYMTTTEKEEVPYRVDDWWLIVGLLSLILLEHTGMTGLLLGVCVVLVHSCSHRLKTTVFAGAVEAMRPQVIFDTGASNTSTNVVGWLRNVIYRRVKMALADGSGTTLDRSGEIQFKGSSIPALYAPSFKKTLVGWNELSKAGYHMVGAGEIINIYTPDKKLWQVATRQDDGLFHLQEMENM